MVWIQDLNDYDDAWSGILDSLDSEMEPLGVLPIPYDTVPDPSFAIDNANIIGPMLILLDIVKVGAEIDVNNLSLGSLKIEPTEVPITGRNLNVYTDGYGVYEDLEVGTKGVHVDHHNLVVIPRDSSTGRYYILNANDGGVAFSKDGGVTFVQTGDTFGEDMETGEIYSTLDGYNVSTFYGVDKMNEEDRYVGGTQDNGSWLSPSDPDATSGWDIAPSGDGFQAAWHYFNPDLILESSQFNSIFRSSDRGKNWDVVQLPADFGPFLTTIANSKQDPDLVFLVDNSGLLKSTDFGQSWEIIEMPEKWVFNEYYVPTVISLANSQVIWSGGNMTENSRAVVSTNEGTDWTVTAKYTDSDLGAISGIATHPAEDSTAYLLFSVAKTSKILKTKDLGQTWTDLSGFGPNGDASQNGFPDVAVYDLLVMPYDTNIIWVGTEIGLFESVDAGSSWHYADNGVPAAAIFQMKIVNDEVILATHGRGIWTVGLPELEFYEPVESFLQPRGKFLTGWNRTINANLNVRDPLDSISYLAITSIDDETTITTIGDTLYNVDSILAIELPVEGLPLEDEIFQGELVVRSYAEGREYVSNTPYYIYRTKPGTISENWTFNFNEDSKEFANAGFSIETPDGFEDPALHTLHPPNPNTRLLAILRTPVVLREETRFLSYDEIVLVEPGEEGAEPGSAYFYDYVGIQMSKDKFVNSSFIDIYDSGKNPTAWGEAIGAETPGEPGLVVQYGIDLLAPPLNTADINFSIGDTVYLSFVLQSDPGVEHWGWAIDNLEIGQFPVGTRDKEFRFTSALAYPNPFNNQMEVKLELQFDQRVSMVLTDLSGKILRTVFNGRLPAGSSEIQINSGAFSSGIYLLSVHTAKEGKQILKVVKN